jgi:hypothetical protein
MDSPITMLPSSTALMSLNTPLQSPTGVLAALTIATSLMGIPQSFGNKTLAFLLESI